MDRAAVAVESGRVESVGAFPPYHEKRSAAKNVAVGVGGSVSGDRVRATRVAPDNGVALVDRDIFRIKEVAPKRHICCRPVRSASPATEAHNNCGPELQPLRHSRFHNSFLPQFARKTRLFDDDANPMVPRSPRKLPAKICAPRKMPQG